MLAVPPTRTRMAVQLFGIIILALLQNGYAQQENEKAFDCMVESFQVFDLSNISTLNATSDCQLFGIQELIRLLAEHPVWTDFNELSDLYRIQALSYCEALQADLFGLCLQQVYWDVIEAINLGWKSALSECRSESTTDEELESFMWNELQSFTLVDLSGNSTLYILRAAAALRPGGPFGQIFGVLPPPENQSDTEQIQNVEKYHEAFCSVNEDNQLCWHSYVSPYFTWHFMGQPYECLNYESWGCCYTDLRRVLFVETNDAYTTNLNISEYSPGPTDDLSDNISLVDIIENTIWPDCQQKECSSIEFLTSDEDNTDGADDGASDTDKTTVLVVGILAGLMVIICMIAWVMYRREKARRSSPDHSPESPTTDYEDKIHGDNRNGSRPTRRASAEESTLIKQGVTRSHSQKNTSTSRGDSLLARSKTLRPGIGFLSTIQEGEFMRNGAGNDEL